MKYMNDGGYDDSAPRSDGSDIDVGIGGGPIAGITIGSVLFLVLLAFFVGRSRARSEDDESVNEDEHASESNEIISSGESGSEVDTCSHNEDGGDGPYIMTKTEDKRKRDFDLNLNTNINNNADDNADNNNNSNNNNNNNTNNIILVGYNLILFQDKL